MNNNVKAMIVLTMKIKEYKPHHGNKAIKKYYSPREMVEFNSKVLEFFNKNSQCYLTDFDIEKILKESFRTLEKHGYVESELSFAEEYTDYIKNPKAYKNSFKPYKIRKYRITQKGINKMKEWAKQNNNKKECA